MTQRTELSDALTRLEASMRAAGCWTLPQPSEDAFKSQQPFALDKMDMRSWLRFIFVPRFRDMLASHQPLPSSCSVTPAAELYLTEMSEGAKRPIIQVLQEIDEIITNGGNANQGTLH